MYTKQRFICDLEEIIAICERELEERKQGIEGHGSVEELEGFFIPEFTRLLEQAKTDTLPPKGKRWLSSAGLADDHWDFEYTSVLQEKLFILDNKYRYKLK